MDTYGVSVLLTKGESGIYNWWLAGCPCWVLNVPNQDRSFNLEFEVFVFTELLVTKSFCSQNIRYDLGISDHPWRRCADWIRPQAIIVPLPLYRSIDGRGIQLLAMIALSFRTVVWVQPQAISVDLKQLWLIILAYFRSAVLVQLTGWIKVS